MTFLSHFSFKKVFGEKYSVWKICQYWAQLNLGTGSLATPSPDPQTLHGSPCEPALNQFFEKKKNATQMSFSMLPNSRSDGKKIAKSIFFFGILRIHYIFSEKWCLNKDLQSSHFFFSLITCSLCSLCFIRSSGPYQKTTPPPHNPQPPPNTWVNLHPPQHPLFNVWHDRLKRYHQKESQKIITWTCPVWTLGITQTWLSLISFYGIFLFIFALQKNHKSLYFWSVTKTASRQWYDMISYHI